MNASFEKNTIGCTYERERCHLSSCDRLKFYKDGKIRFESYCYGEAATLIFSCFALAPLAENGELLWQENMLPPRDVMPPSRLETLTPLRLTAVGSPFIWHRTKELKSDPNAGYDKLYSFFLRIK